jgi:Mn-dependent DtxR family transcriptional regulator
MKTTPDEKFLFRLFELAQGDTEKEFDYIKVAASIRIKETAAKNIVKLLAQANLIKKTGDKTVRLTPRGCDFVKEHR